jgi:hypothetical protein
MLNSLIDMDRTVVDTDPTTQESDTLFSEIESLIFASHLPQQYKTIVQSDLDDAQLAYKGGAFKACVVMLGGALEGLMLGTLLRTDTLNALAGGTGTVPACIQRLGTGDPNLGDRIGNELSFEDYKVCMHELIPDVDGLGIDNIQAFRNAIHPWKAVQEPIKYSDFDRARAIHYLGSFKKIADAIYNWTP